MLLAHAVFWIQHDNVNNPQMLCLFLSSACPKSRTFPFLCNIGTADLNWPEDVLFHGMPCPVYKLGSKELITA